MAEKIKSFFKKKIKDKQFNNAGVGHRLNESTSSATTSKPANVQKRHEPTHDARVAGQAALARLEKAKTAAPKLNTSYSAIQARVKKELEQEKLAQANQATDVQTKSTDKTEVSDEPITHMLAVNGVYYRCPLVSEEILDKEVWFEKLQEFFGTQLSEDEAGLSACLVIRSCNDGEDRINGCIETLCKYLDNIKNDPSEKKYWKIRMSNRIFQEKVKPFRGSMDLLKAAGFVQEKLMHQDKEEDFLVWSPDRSSVENITMLMDALISAETVQLQLDRNVQVLLPSQAAERSVLPTDFYFLTPEEVKHQQAERAKLVEQGQMLLTKAMREKLMKDKERRYRFSLIRIRFPDNIILQGTFTVSESVKDIVNFVKEHLLSEDFPFYLITATREKLTEEDFDKTLESLKLVPAVVLSFFWDTSSNPEAPPRYLNDETLNFLQSM